VMDEFGVDADARSPSFESFFESEYGRLVRLLYAMALDLPEAEDIA